MKALCWTGGNKTSVETVPDPSLLNSHDVILRVKASATCGSDLHLLAGYIPAMRKGDVLGHEFMGEVVEVGSGVRKHKVGDRVVVAPFLACGACWHCKQERYSLCDNGNPNPAITEAMWGYAPSGCFAYSHALGGWAGSHAEYVRVPFADVGAFPVPDNVSDITAVFASDAAPTAWTGADSAGITPGDTVAVWGAGAVGQMAARAALLLGAGQVIVIDRLPERLQQARDVIGADTLDYSSDHIAAELRERTGGRGPDVVIEAVGMEAHSTGPMYAVDKAKQLPRLQTDRPIAVRAAAQNVRKGGSMFVLGVFAEFVDTFPLGAIMNKNVTLRGAQVHAQKYIPMILDRMSKGEIVTEHLATHVMSLEDGPKGYDMFKNKTEGCVRAVFVP